MSRNQPLEQVCHDLWGSRTRSHQTSWLLSDKNLTHHQSFKKAKSMGVYKYVCIIHPHVCT